MKKSLLILGTLILSIGQIWAQDKDLNDAVVVLSAQSHTYDGTAFRPTILSIKDGGVDLIADQDYEAPLIYGNNTNVADESYVSIEGKGDYAGTEKKIVLTIEPKTFAQVTFDLQNSSVDYNGSPQQIEIVNILLTSYTLSSSDYDIIIDGAPGNAVTDFKEGGYSIRLKGKGNFKDETVLEKTFKIVPYPLADDMLTIETAVYNGNTLTPNVTLLFGSNPLTVDEDYEVELTDQSAGAYKEVGEWDVKVKGLKNFSGEIVGKFKIQAAPSPTDYYTVKLTVADGIDLLNYSSGDLDVEAGGYLFLQFAPETEGEIILKVNGKEIDYKKNTTGYFSYILTVEKDYTVELYLTSYTVSLPIVEGVTFEGEAIAEYGKPYTFTFTLSDDLDPSTLKVYVNDIEVIPEPLRTTSYSVTIDKVTGPIVIRVEANTVGIQPLDVNRLYTMDGSLFIETLTPQFIQVYDMVGVQRYNSIVDGQISIPLAKGIYIVRVGKEVQKVVVK